MTDLYPAPSRAPRTLTAASTIAASGAWVAVAAVFGIQRLPDAVHDVDSFLTFVFFGWIAVGLLFLVFVAGCVVAIAGAVGTVPSAIAWWQTSPRSAPVGVALGHAVVAWAVLAWVVLVVVL
jgi:hypothetical protein